MKPTETDILIERFFDATATPEEEARLKAILTDPTTEPTEAMEEARAVMGFTAVQRAVAATPQRPNVMRRWIAAASVAASVAVVGLIGWHMAGGTSNEPADTAVIYANGRVIHSTDHALDIMAAQLGAMGDASENSDTERMLRALEVMKN